MDIEVGSDAVPGAVHVVEPHRPEGLPREGVQAVAADAGGEDGTSQLDVACKGETRFYAIDYKCTWSSWMLPARGNTLLC